MKNYRNLFLSAFFIYYSLDDCLLSLLVKSKKFVLHLFLRLKIMSLYVFQFFGSFILNCKTIYSNQDFHFSQNYYFLCLKFLEIIKQMKIKKLNKSLVGYKFYLKGYESKTKRNTTVFSSICIYGSRVQIFEKNIVIVATVL